MDAENETFLRAVKEDMVRLLDKKYRAGYAEHAADNGDIWDIPNIADFALEESIDLLVYVMALKRRQGAKPTDLGGGVPAEVADDEHVREGEILVKRIDQGHDGILHPKKDGDVGYDLVSSEDFTLPPHMNASAAFVVPAGVHIKAPAGYFCQIVGRSSAAKRGVGVQTAIIDNGYTGPMFACVWNLTGEEIRIKKGERLAQAVFLPICTFPLRTVEELPATERGDTGFGSTGT